MNTHTTHRPRGLSGGGGRALALALGGLLLAAAASAQNQAGTGTTPRTGTGTVAVGAPGVPTQTYVRPADSSAGVTQATSHKDWLRQCDSGYVLSGGVCVPLPSLNLPNCAYGEVWTGGSCVPIGSFNPPPTSCNTGFVLSGGVCVPLPAGTPTPSPTCPTMPESSQTAACPAGETGQQFMRRTATCDASTGYAWQMGSWYTESSTCAPVPSGGQPPSTVTCDNVQYDVGWTAGRAGSGECQARANAVGAGPGSSFTLVNTNPGYTGSATFLCPAGGGGWQVSGSPTCAPTAAVTPPAAQCPAMSGAHNWGAQCSATLSAPATAVGGTYQVSDARSNGTAVWNCAAGGSWVQASGTTCSPQDPVLPIAGCPSQLAPLPIARFPCFTHECLQQDAAWPLLPPTANGGSVPFSYYARGDWQCQDAGHGAAFVCSAGRWTGSGYLCSTLGFD